MQKKHSVQELQTLAVKSKQHHEAGKEKHMVFTKIQMDNHSC